MDWHAGYSSRFELVAKNADWTDGAVIPYLKGADIDRDGTDDAPLLESCSVELDADSLEDVYEGWARIDLIATQGAETARVPLGCFNLSVKSAALDKGFCEAKLDGTSVLSGADSEIGAGAYVARGENVGEWVRKLLQPRVPSTITVDGAAQLASTIVFGDSDTYLDAAWAALDAVGWVMRIGGDGNVTLQAAPSMPTVYWNEGNPPGIQGGVDVDGSEVSYTREFDPSVGLFDVVGYGYPQAGLSGNKTIKQQSIECGCGAAVSETVEASWRR